ncbi:MAG: DUF2017 domain-containing protein [Chthoniobacter sp.]|nr:DUF2017 domain-containing protein [Chthoniobacter sp.]
MRVRHLDEAHLEVSGIGFVESALLWRLAAAADPSGNPAAEQRLASSPTGGAEPGLEEDWKEHVLPELKVLFSSAVGVVRLDIVRSWIAPGTDASLRIPLQHVEAWLLALNQARLALAARNNLTETEMEQRPPDDFQPGTIAHLFVDFFGHLQELLLEATGAADGEAED